jgi:hypothetical protein
MFHSLFAWSWDGHGQLTTFAVAMALERLFRMGKQFIIGRLARIAVVEANIQRSVLGSAGFPPIDDAMRKKIEDIDKQPATELQKSLIVLFDDLPSKVQTEDIHAGNASFLGDIPIFGILWHLLAEEDSQVRHFMRSTPKTSRQGAFLKSRKYIWDNLWEAWGSFSQAVRQQSLGDFDDGMSSLAKALHTIEDSYAYGHVQRLGSVIENSAAMIIDDVHLWDDENKKASGTWMGHKYYDDPASKGGVAGGVNPAVLFERAQQAAADFIYCVLGNADQSRASYQQNCTDLMQQYFWCSANLKVRDQNDPNLK